MPSPPTLVLKKGKGNTFIWLLDVSVGIYRTGHETQGFSDGQIRRGVRTSCSRSRPCVPSLAVTVQKTNLTFSRETQKFYAQSGPSLCYWLYQIFI